MDGKVLLILVDGMRPDAVTSCNHPAVGDFMENSLYTLSARTVMPSVTLPTHMSLFPKLARPPPVYVYTAHAHVAFPQRTGGTARHNNKYIFFI